MPEWIDTVVKLTPAVVTLVVGAVASTIAFLQFHIAREKLRLELFSRRLDAYNGLHEFFASVLRDGAVVSAALPLLARARSQSQFLFGPEIHAVFEEMWKRAVDANHAHRRLCASDAPGIGPERSALCEREHEVIGWMLERMKDAPKLYSKYLQFK